ncbi:MAG: ureidoglycolate lyase [Chloroflexota bacterium]
MSETQIVHRLPCKATSDPAFAKIARLVAEPQRDPAKHTEFFPALANFNIGSGTVVDVSLYYGQPSASLVPRSRFDRHLQSDEFFVALKGDWYMPMAPCRHPEDLDERPHAKDMSAFLVREGEMFVLLPNVWHAGVWPAKAGKEIKFMMVLSGHRAGSGLQGRVDHVVLELSDGGSVVPDL